MHGSTLTSNKSNLLLVPPLKTNSEWVHDAPLKHNPQPRQLPVGIVIPTYWRSNKGRIRRCLNRRGALARGCPKFKCRRLCTPQSAFEVQGDKKKRKSAEVTTDPAVTRFEKRGCAYLTMAICLFGIDQCLKFLTLRSLSTSGLS